jgi:4'-phosphopantetheinyl transferase EntD
MAFITPIDPPHIFQKDGISVNAFTFDLEHYDFGLFNSLNVKFPESLRNSVNKRQAEFLAGRFSAKHALEGIGITHFDIEIGCNRQPLWPAGIVGSITHTHDTVLCIVARKTDYSSLGIDTEHILNEKTAREISKNILTQREVNVLTAHCQNFNKICTLAFSAKESLFKAIYCRVNEYFDFLDVEIVQSSNSQNHLCFKIIKDLSQEIKAGMNFNCYYYLCNDTVHTLTFEEA